jgi:hypothetical protein
VQWLNRNAPWTFFRDAEQEDEAKTWQVSMYACNNCIYCIYIVYLLYIHIYIQCGKPTNISTIWGWSIHPIYGDLGIYGVVYYQA